MKIWSARAVLSLVLVVAVVWAGADPANDHPQTNGLSVGEIVATVMAALFALAFAAWAKRLDKALDLLERIQEQMHAAAVQTERRLTRLEALTSRSTRVEDAQ